jgi:hypothetical protein
MTLGAAALAYRLAHLPSPEWLDKGKSEKPAKINSSSVQQTVAFVFRADPRAESNCLVSDKTVTYLCFTQPNPAKKAIHASGPP